MKLNFKIILFLIGIFCTTILFLGIKGNIGNPNEQNINLVKWTSNGPFELSPERGRFALIYSLVENHTFYFSIPLARFTLPDLGYKNGHYVSLFAPAVSFIAIPGYIIGKYFNASQVGVFATSAFFALLNGILIYLISKKLGAGKIAAVLGALTFLFATPAFAYSTTIYEHHISTFILLLAIWFLINWNNFWSLGAIWFLCALSIPVDYPNLFLMAPIGLFALGRIFAFEKLKDKINFSIKPTRILSFAAVIIPLAFFLWFNLRSYGNPLQFSGTVGGVDAIDATGKPASSALTNPQDVQKYLNPDSQQKSAVRFFQTRDSLNGIYIHVFSPDRGIIYFTPVILLGIIGGIILYKKKNKYLAIFLAIIGADILLYSMWGDPWGGWAFGSRYLIPAYSILAIFISVALSKLNRKLLFVIPFLLLLIYSIGVNTLGTLTSNANPPQAEALALEAVSHRQERYSFDRDWQYLNETGSKSFVYQTWVYKYLKPVDYYYSVAGAIILISTILTIALFLNKNHE